MRYLRMIGLTLMAALFAGQANAEPLTGTLKNIKETGTITLGFRNSSIPFSYLDDNQKPIGFAMDICYRIVDAVKKELKLDKLDVKLNPVTSSTRIPLLANGTIDLECGSTTNNAEREKQVAFTNTHFLTASRFVSKKSAKIGSIDDLKGKTRGLDRRHHQHQATHGSQCRPQSRGQHHPRQGPCRGIPDGRDRSRGRLRDGRHPAGEPGGGIEGSGGLRHLDGCVLEARALRHHAAQGRSGIQEGGRWCDGGALPSGEGQKLYDKWFMQKIPPKGLNLNTPIATGTQT